ncbi:MAG: polysaccharide biosynthesis C-terminal domain-containing protein [Spirochaetales bacterium]|nr:polysaccharide biosynthesis C-terminal domain-containing protein [Spirochaetales bacterium]
MKTGFSRTDLILRKKLRQYLLPTMASYAALSLNEFLDSMLVSNMLGSKAMAIVNLGMPLMLVVAAAYSLLGSGAATVYAVFLGKRDHEGAGRSLTVSMVMALVVGLVILAGGMLFFNPVSRLLCRDAELMGEFSVYLRVLLFSTPFLTAILTFTTLLPSAGYPGYSMVINVVANVVNIFMDYVYIHIFRMGVEGAAWATLTGYLVGLIVLVVLILGKKIRVYVSFRIRASFSLLKKVLVQGGPEAMTQIGFSLQFAFCNALASTLAGTAGIVALSLCLQANSIVSIFLGSIMGSSVPIMSLLHGQRDFSGDASVLRTSIKWQVVIAAVVTGVCALFAHQIAAIYNIRDSLELSTAVQALRIYSLMLFIRSSVILFFSYLKVVGFAPYATLVSALDSFGVIIPIAWLLSRLFGIAGLWWAFPTTAVLILVFMVIRNGIIASRSEGRFKGLLLIETDEDSTPVMDVTIGDDPASIAGISEKMQAVCEQNGISGHNAVLSALAVEEMAVYITGKKDHKAYMDILVRLEQGNVVIDFRSLGTVFDPLTDMEGDCSENVRLLRGIASSIGNDYTLGMNSTRIVISGNPRPQE